MLTALKNFFSGFMVFLSFRRFTVNRTLPVPVFSRKDAVVVFSDDVTQSEFFLDALGASDMTSSSSMVRSFFVWCSVGREGSRCLEEIVARCRLK